MKCRILHESRGRIRVHLECCRMSLREADILEYYLKSISDVESVKVFDRTQDAVVVYRGARAGVVQALAGFSFTSEQALACLPEHTPRAEPRI